VTLFGSLCQISSVEEFEYWQSIPAVVAKEHGFSEESRAQKDRLGILIFEFAADLLHN
jgi:hypothetical protein